MNQRHRASVQSRAAVLLIGLLAACGSPPAVPVIVRAVAPAYPALAVQARASGRATVEVVIDQTGNVTSARTIEFEGTKGVFDHEWYATVARPLTSPAPGSSSSLAAGRSRSRAADRRPAQLPRLSHHNVCGQIVVTPNQIPFSRNR